MTIPIGTKANPKVYPPLITKRGKLFIGNVSLSKIIRRFGTPTFVISKAQIVKNHSDVTRAFRLKGLQSQFFYSLKTNSHPFVMNLTRSLGSGIEVVSRDELDAAISAGFEPSAIIFNAPCKKKADIERAVRLGVKMINCDSLAEFASVEHEASAVGRIQDVGIRIDPENNPNNKFGVALSEAKGLAQAIKHFRNVCLVGLHFHLGTKIVEPRSYEKAAEISVRLAVDLQSDHQSLSCLDIGGGFPSSVDLDDQRGSLYAYARHVAGGLKRVNRRSAIKCVFLEPGRCIVGDAIVCLATVVNVKQLKGIHWAILDVGINALPGLRHANYKFLPVHFDQTANRKPCRLAGPLCMQSDFFRNSDRLLPLATGDLIVIANAGAYTLALATEFCYSLPKVILVDGNRVIIRKSRPAGW